jgi:hypothetical protein
MLLTKDTGMGLIPKFHNAAHHSTCQVEALAALSEMPPLVHDNTTADVAAKFESWAGAKEKDRAMLLYGVSGHNRVFQDRDCALAALKKTRGGELFFTYDEVALWEFVEAEAARMKAAGL